MTLQANQFQSVKQDREKHIDLDLAAGQINHVVRRLEDLSSRISGQADETRCEAGEPCVAPTLESILTVMPGRLRERTETCLQLISEIESKLF